MNPKLAVLATIAVLPVLASAAEETTKPAGYELKNRSTFTATEVPRAPFWPIGWAKRSEKSAMVAAAAPVAQKAVLDPSQFKITSILLGSPSLAVINGRAYEEGEFLKAARPAASAPGSAAPVAAAPQPRIRVQQITDNSVVLQFGEQALTIPFNRPGIAARPAGRDLLLEDR